MKQVVIFSDLDGTLLDAETYSFEKALPALDRIKREGHRSGTGPFATCSTHCMQRTPCLISLPDLHALNRLLP